MKHVWFIILVSCGLALDGRGEEKALPPDSKELVSTLEKFEETERFTLEVKIEEKRKEVSRILEKHLQRETQAGNLDAALALKALIEGLAGDEPDNGKTSEESSAWLMTWEEARTAFGAIEATVPATKNRTAPVLSGFRVSAKQGFLIIPNPKDTWTGGGSKEGKFCDFRGYYPAKTKSAWMRLYYAIDNGDPIPVDPTTVNVADRDGFVRLFVEDEGAKGNKGEIRVAIVPKK